MTGWQFSSSSSWFYLPLNPVELFIWILGDLKLLWQRKEINFLRSAITPFPPPPPPLCTISETGIKDLRRSLKACKIFNLRWKAQTLVNYRHGDGFFKFRIRDICIPLQEPIIRSEQLSCARVSAFSRTSLFLERFWREFWISFKFHKPVSKTYGT